MKDFSKIENLINCLNSISETPRFSIEVFDEKSVIYASSDKNLTIVYNLLYEITLNEVIYLSIDDSKELYITVRKL